MNRECEPEAIDSKAGNKKRRRQRVKLQKERGDEARTRDPQLGRLMLYQLKLLPQMCWYVID